MTGKKFETIKQNKTIALSILHVPDKTCIYFKA